MRKLLLPVSIISAFSFSQSALADSNHSKGVNPASHAPAGVMVDHSHKKGEIMLGYRYMEQSFSQLYYGSHKISQPDLAAAGYSMAPSGMTMKMHMLDIMYALNDTVTLMLMPQYMSMDMTMVMLDSMNTGMTAMNNMDTDNMHSGHSHGTSGMADTQVSALIRLYQQSNHQWIANLGLSVPTGSVSEKNSNGQFTHYGMQLGSGTYDFVPSVTYTGNSDSLSWGAQVSAKIKLENRNESGFAFGDQYQLTGWLAYRLARPLSLSARLSHQSKDKVSGHYNNLHGHSAPADSQTNYGGQFTDLGLGINYAQQNGYFKGVRLGIEWQTRIAQNYNGYQLGLDDGLYTSLSYAF